MINYFFKNSVKACGLATLDFKLNLVSCGIALEFFAQKMEIEIEVNRRLQILLEKLMMVENRISILSRRVAQLEQEMDTSIEEEDSSEDTSGSDIEVIYPAGICYFVSKVVMGKAFIRSTYNPLILFHLIGPDNMEAEDES